MNELIMLSFNISNLGRFGAMNGSHTSHAYAMIAIGIHMLKTKKPSGEDDIFSELLRASSTFMIKELHTLFNQIFTRVSARQL